MNQRSFHHGHRYECGKNARCLRDRESAQILGNQSGRDEADCDRRSGRCQAALKAAGIQEKLSLINPQFFKHPLAPSVAAEIEGREVDSESIYKAYWRLSKKYEVVVVEGIGGVKVPLGETTYVVDLIEALRLPALVVSRAGLGTLNHTLLTLDALAQEKVPVLGVLFNGGTGKSLAEKTNPDALQDHTTVQVLGSLRSQESFRNNPDLRRRPKR